MIIILVAVFFKFRNEKTPSAVRVGSKKENESMYSKYKNFEDLYFIDKLANMLDTGIGIPLWN